MFISLPRRLSVFTLVILAPVCVACFLALRQHYVVTAQSVAFDRCRCAIVSGVEAPVYSVIKAFGQDDSVRVLSELDLISEDVAFNRGRWIQILRVANTHQLRGGDEYVFGAVIEQGQCSCTLPDGAVIDQISFDHMGLNIWIYGDITQGSYRYSIPQSSRKKYHVPWPPNGPKPTTKFQNVIYDMLAADYCIPANHYTSDWMK